MRGSSNLQIIIYLCIFHDFPLPHHMGFPAGSDDKESTCSAGDLGSIPGSGSSPEEGNGNPLQYSCWKIPRTEEPGELQSMGSQRVRYDRMTFAFHHTDNWEPRVHTGEEDPDPLALSFESGSLQFRHSSKRAQIASFASEEKQHQVLNSFHCAPIPEKHKTQGPPTKTESPVTCLRVTGATFYKDLHLSIYFWIKYL